MTEAACLSYTIRAAVVATGITRSNLFRAIRSGDLESFKVGRQRMISRKALEDFIDRRQCRRAA